MLRYTINRLLYGILVLFGVVTLVFFLFHVLPGDPARMMLGQRADMESIETINKDLGRDKPLVLQYLSYLNDISPVSFYNVSNLNSAFYCEKEILSATYSKARLSENSMLVIKNPYLRLSYQSKRPVSELLTEAFIPTMVLSGVAILFASLVGVFLGIISALNKDSWIDRFILIISTLGMSLPSFFAAILVAWLFAFLWSDYTGLSMFGSLYTVDDFGRGEFINLKNLILPAFTLSIRPLAVIMELSRGSFLEVLSQDYIRTAKSKGLNTFKIIVNHALRNALNPIVTTVSGWFASLMAGAVFIEYVFDWKGIGVVLVDALEKYDFPVVMGAVLFVSVLLIIINIFADIIYGILDPKIRYI